MPGIAPPCDQCKHPQAVHGRSDSVATGIACRVTRCECEGYVEPTEEPAEPEPDPKRLVIEIPDGFAVTVQLMPLEPS